MKSRSARPAAKTAEPSRPKGLALLVRAVTPLADSGRVPERTAVSLTDDEFSDAGRGAGIRAAEQAVDAGVPVFVIEGGKLVVLKPGGER